MTIRLSALRPVRRACAFAPLAAAAFIAVAVTFAACGDDMYGRYACRFVFNTKTHAHSAALTSAVGSKGIFCRVSKTTKGGAQYFHFATGAGLADDVIFTAEDQRTTVLLGSNTYSGSLIFGYSNLDDPAQFYGFDGECPNCFDPNTLPIKSYPLSIDNNGLATCSTCKRKYNLNTGGNVVNGDNGSPLTRYHANYSTAGVVTVTN